MRSNFTEESHWRHSADGEIEDDGVGLFRGDKIVSVLAIGGGYDFEGFGKALL